MNAAHKEMSTPLAFIPDDWCVKTFKDALVIVERPVNMSDDSNYQLVTVKRRYGGVVERSYLVPVRKPIK
ncbi:hypothetical protein, partial [Sansalvadorimonas verongulae]|uniref:hypothetical protein n=1 Tax=Sansalvadorimonas verongulae TaxID=2172824 RepID=UPI001E41EDD1